MKTTGRVKIRDAQDATGMYIGRVFIGDDEAHRTSRRETRKAARAAAKAWAEQVGIINDGASA